MRLKKFAVLLLAMVLAAAVVPSFAQEAPPLPGTPLLTDVFSPRGVAIDAEGNVYVAIAGNGGETTIQSETPEGTAEISVGMSGSVTMIAADGTVTPVIQAIPSFAMPGETVGIYRAIPHDGSLWLIYTAVPGAFYADSIVEIDLATQTARTVINLGAFEADNNPDGNEIDSNVTDIAWAADGSLLISDAGANTLYSWTADAGLAVVATWSENSVPTSVEIGEDGSVYVGFLGAGLAPGAGKVEQWLDGALITSWNDLNAVTDILLTDEGVYAVELVRFGAEGPGAGGVLLLAADGTVTSVVEGLLAPFGIAQGEDGALYVSFGSVAFAPGMSGGVVRIEPGM